MTGGKRTWEPAVSEAELRILTRELDEAHRASTPVLFAAAAEIGEQMREREDTLSRLGDPMARRRFLIGLGAGAAALSLAACGSDDKESKTASSAPATTGSGTSVYTGDLKVVALATALENQAVGAYQAALGAASAGKLGTVPPAVATFVQTAMAQHADHAKAWNAVLTGAGKPAITDVPLKSQAAVTAALGKAGDIPTVAKLALSLEDQAAQTYLFAEYNVTSAGGISTAATIAPVEAMHAAILHFVLGEYPVPKDFLPVDMAAKPDDLTV
ncbi:ferritin-like domain-containing protein [Embleya sp. NPDC020630]|uniref:ferritin-like domain-containing protein n=1 Tax=Embleya sp. NPDC020630 TaxID=3363979 RepID=UPI0037BD4E4B